MIAYRELRKLELNVLRALYNSGQQKLDISSIVQIDVDQFHGIEIEEFPAQMHFKSRCGSPTTNERASVGKISGIAAAASSAQEIRAYRPRQRPATGLAKCAPCLTMQLCDG